ncbi:hypothetical protein, partial [Enterobacter cloacae]|uniref:hypothetical protein n=1 Tax=Enterobacter cloacae TaxID=550 RepID=UPI001954021E
MGDIGIFLALLRALDVSPAWRRRLIKDFRRNDMLADDLKRLADPSTHAPPHAGLLAALEGADPK